MRDGRGFSLLEVLVAMFILSLAVLTLFQLASQALRLVKLSGEQQTATLLAERLTREARLETEDVERGQEGGLTWERRFARMPIPDELAAPSGRPVQLLALIVTVRWDGGRALEVATLRSGRASVR
jgi:prepilin-type N-terminal cleavage/methylation domain-containing protein